jgi:hypothetical protein
MLGFRSQGLAGKFSKANPQPVPQRQDAGRSRMLGGFKPSSATSPLAQNSGMGSSIRRMMQNPGPSGYPFGGGIRQVLQEGVPRRGTRVPSPYERATQLQGAPFGGYQQQTGGMNPYQQAFMNMRGQQAPGPRFPAMSQYSRPYNPNRQQLYNPAAPGGPSRARQGFDWANPGYWFSDNMGEQGTKFFGLPSQEDPYPSILPGIPGTSSSGMFGALGSLF